MTENPYLMQLVRRAFKAQDSSLLQLSFDVAVLDKYRAVSAFEIIRTNTVGRIKRQGGWSVDVGISEDERTIHASVRDVVEALPEDERDHWAQHIVSLPLSRTFLQMRLAGGGSCIDDGEIRPWE